VKKIRIALALLALITAMSLSACVYYGGRGWHHWGWHDRH
jgi:hypothetical protein